MFNRAPDGSPRYLNEPIPDDNFAEMHYDDQRGVWVAEIELDANAEQIDFFSNYLSRVKHNGGPMKHISQARIREWYYEAIRLALHLNMTLPTSLTESEEQHE